MDKQQAQLIEQSYRDVLSVEGEKFTGLFYRRLFEQYPEVRALFEKTDMHAQQRMLFEALATVAENVHSPTSLKVMLIDLGRTHAARHVKPEYYARFGRIMIDTLGELMGDRWTDDMRAAWSILYADTVSFMISYEEDDPDAAQDR